MEPPLLPLCRLLEEGEGGEASSVAKGKRSPPESPSEKESGEEEKIIRIRDGIGRVLLPQPPLQSKHDGKRDRNNGTEARREAAAIVGRYHWFLLGNTAFLESSTGRGGGGRIGWGLETRTWMRRRRRRVNEREKMGVGVPFPSSSFLPLSPPRKNKYSEACRSTPWGCIHSSSSSITTTITK